MIPFAIDNADHRLADVLNELLARVAGRPFEVATAYFSISGYRLVREKLHAVGSFRLLIGSDLQNALMVAQTAGKVFSPQNWLKSGSSWQGETLVAGTLVGLLSGLPTGPTLIERMKAPPNAFEKRWSAE